MTPLSGAHSNPVVSLALAWRGDITRAVAAAYVATQAVGALAGVGLANAMFGTPVFALSGHARSGAAQWLSECVFTFGLVGAVWGFSGIRLADVPRFVAAELLGAAVAVVLFRWLVPAVIAPSTAQASDWASS